MRKRSRCKVAKNQHLAQFTPNFLSRQTEVLSVKRANFNSLLVLDSNLQDFRVKLEDAGKKQHLFIFALNCKCRLLFKLSNFARSDESLKFYHTETINIHLNNKIEYKT